MLWHVFDFMTNLFDIYMTSWQTFWRHGVFLMSLRCFWRVFDVMTNFLKYVVLIDIMTNVLMSCNCLTTWHTFDVLTLFLHYDERFVVMTHFDNYFLEQNIMEMWFRYYNEICDVMTCFDVMTKWRVILFYGLTSWRICCSRTNFLTLWHIFDFISHFLHHDVFLT